MHIINAKYIIPVIPDNKIYLDHSIIFDEEKIYAVLPIDEAAKLYPKALVHNRMQHVVIPGLINAHTHTPMSLLRGLADDLPLMQWLEEHIWPAEQKFVNDKFVSQGSTLAVAEMLRSGTTTFNDMYFFPEETAKVADKIGIRAVLGQIIIDFPSSWAKDTQEYLDKGKQLHEQYKDHALISTVLAPHAPYTVSDENLMKVKQCAENQNTRIHIHLHETLDEINGSIAQYKNRPIKRLDELGIIDGKLIAVHMAQLNNEDTKIILKQKPHLIHCPESNMKLASGISPVQKLMNEGLNIALGTDGAASNNDLNMFSEMKSASFLSKINTMDATSLNAETALKMATINGAKALGLEDKIGSLESGKQADLCIINIDDIECQPLYHPTSQLLYAAGREHVTDVWVKGKQLLNNKELTTIDLDEVKTNCQLWHNKISQFS